MVTRAALATLATLALLFGVPKLYGTGCDAHLFGFAESDFIGRCDRIAAI